MRGQLLFVVIVAAAIGALTWIVGWLGVVLGAAVVGVAFRQQGGGGWRVAAAAALAWGTMLLADASTGPLGRLASVLGGVMKVPGLVLIALTLIFAAALAWSAATVAALLSQMVARRATSVR